MDYNGINFIATVLLDRWASTELGYITAIVKSEYDTWFAMNDGHAFAIDDSVLFCVRVMSYPPILSIGHFVSQIRCSDAWAEGCALIDGECFRQSSPNRLRCQSLLRPLNSIPIPRSRNCSAKRDSSFTGSTSQRKFSNQYLWPPNLPRLREVPKPPLW